MCGSESLRLALYQPDIAQNAGALARLACCLGLALEVVEPCGFVLGDRRMRRAGLDYMERATVRRHSSWAAFRATLGDARLLLLTTRGEEVYHRFAYRPGDVLLLGRESGGVPEEVHAAATARLRIPLVQGARSLNVATAAAMVAGEALRQTDGWPAG